MERAEPDTWAGPPLTQLWGPRFNVYVVAEDDVGVFTLGRLPSAGAKRELGLELADRLHALLGGEAVPYRDAGRALGVHPNQLRYAAPTGRLRVRWDGAGPPLVWTVPAPDIDPAEARLELARRYLHHLGPSTAAGFGRWAGVKPRQATATFDELGPSLLEVDTPIGAAFVLAHDADSFQRDPTAVETTSVRLLPGGDSFVLRWDRERHLQVDDATLRADLWPSRVWPGALLVGGELAGTWRRTTATVTVTPWRHLDDPTSDAVEHEARSLPLPGLERDITVTWQRPLRERLRSRAGSSRRRGSVR